MKTMRRLAVAAMAAALLLGPAVGGASARPALPRNIPIGNIGRVVLLPPSPCRPSEFGGERCIAVGPVAQVYLLPPSPCDGTICFAPTP